MVGWRALWGERDQTTTAHTDDDSRVQFTVKYNFGTKL